MVSTLTRVAFFSASLSITTLQKQRGKNFLKLNKRHKQSKSYTRTHARVAAQPHAYFGGSMMELIVSYSGSKYGQLLLRVIAGPLLRGIGDANMLIDSLQQIKKKRNEKLQTDAHAASKNKKQTLKKTKHRSVPYERRKLYATNLRPRTKTATALSTPRKLQNFLAKT